MVQKFSQSPPSWDIQVSTVCWQFSGDKNCPFSVGKPGLFYQEVSLDMCSRWLWFVLRWCCTLYHGIPHHHSPPFGRTCLELFSPNIKHQTCKSHPRWISLYFNRLQFGVFGHIKGWCVGFLEVMTLASSKTRVRFLPSPSFNIKGPALTTWSVQGKRLGDPVISISGLSCEMCVQKRV